MGFDEQSWFVCNDHPPPGKYLKEAVEELLETSQVNILQHKYATAAETTTTTKSSNNNNNGHTL